MATSYQKLLAISYFVSKIDIDSIVSYDGMNTQQILAPTYVFLIAALSNSCLYNVIQQIKKPWPNKDSIEKSIAGL